MIYINAHRLRVVNIGLAIQSFRPILDLPDEMLTAFLHLHDLSKLEPDIFRSLSLHYGRSLNDPNYSENSELQSLIQRLNSIDLNHARSFFARHGLLDTNYCPTVVAKELLRIEKIADLVDRALDPAAWEDFGRKLHPASHYLPNFQDQHLAQELEKRYPQITQGLSFQEIKAKINMKTDEQMTINDKKLKNMVNNL